MNKRLCFIIDSLSGGGAERVVLNLSNKMCELGHEVHIIILDNKISYDLSNVKFNLHILSKDRKLVKNRFLNKILLSRKLKKVFSNIEKEYGKFNLVVSNLEDSDKLSSMAKLPNLFHCYHIAMSKFLEDKIQHKKKFKSFYRGIKFRLKNNFIYNNSNIIAVSNGVKNDILSYGVKPKSIKTIYNPFNLDEIIRKSKEKLEQIPKEKYIINVARFSTQKRHDILIHAYAKSNIEHKLVILGTCDKPADEENLLNIKKIVKELNLDDRIVFAGFQKNPYPWIKNADLFVLSSDHEGFGNVLVESLALGTMVVSTDCVAGPSEILIGELSEFLSPPRDIDALAINIKKAIQNPIDIEKKFVENFDAEIIANKYLELCD